MLACVQVLTNAVSVAIRSSRVVRVLALSATIVVTGCRQSFGSGDDLPRSVDPAEIEGFYAIHQVDGHDLGWYHNLGGVNCQLAFLEGGLEVSSDLRFFLELGYNYRCVANEALDGSDVLRIQGTVLNESDGVFALQGFGPNLFEPERGIDNWNLAFSKTGEFITLRITGKYRDFMADPVLTLGPRSTP